MKIGTVLKAGSLALEIFNHKSTRQLSGLVKNGIQRRGLWDSIQGRPLIAPTPAKPVDSLRSRPHTRPPSGRLPAAAHALPDWPKEPLKKALKYVTPENAQKAAQWHGILKSFLDKK